MATVMDCIADGRKQLPREPQQPGANYTAFVDMSGGSSDDAVLAIAHKAKDRNLVVLDLVVSQTGKAPFNPRHAVKKFAGIVKSYGCSTVVGDAYAGETFRADFSEHDINYRRCSRSKSELYEQIEPKLNAREIELLDIPKLQEQLLTLVWRGTRIDHLAGDHDDFANAAVGALIEAGRTVRMPRIRNLGGDDPVPVKGHWLSADNHYFRGLGS